jgi:hypothetical protein
MHTYIRTYAHFVIFDITVDSFEHGLMEGVWGSRSIAPHILRPLYLREIAPVHTAQEVGWATGREGTFNPATTYFELKEFWGLRNLSTPYFSLPFTEKFAKFQAQVVPIQREQPPYQIQYCLLVHQITQDCF